eukprot:415452-Prymnesium_polylepis.3
MAAEHTASSDSFDRFITGNYGVTTTPQLEWWFVTDPERDEEWPKEEKLHAASPNIMRSPLLSAEMARRLDKVNRQLAMMKEPELIKEEALGARI